MLPITFDPLKPNPMLAEVALNKKYYEISKKKKLENNTMEIKILVPENKEKDLDNFIKDCENKGFEL